MIIRSMCRLVFFFSLYGQLHMFNYFTLHLFNLFVKLLTGGASTKGPDVARGYNKACKYSTTDKFSCQQKNLCQSVLQVCVFFQIWAKFLYYSCVMNPKGRDGYRYYAYHGKMFFTYLLLLEG